MTNLATHDLDQPDLLALIADEHTPLGKLRMKDFRAACLADARANEGWVHPSRVSRILHAALGEIDPRSFSAKWAPACGRDGFLDKTDVLARIDPEHSRGNGGKSVRLRRWRGWPTTSFPQSPIPARLDRAGLGGSPSSRYARGEGRPDLETKPPHRRDTTSTDGAEQKEPYL